MTVRARGNGFQIDVGGRAARVRYQHHGTREEALIIEKEIRLCLARGETWVPPAEKLLASEKPADAKPTGKPRLSDALLRAKPKYVTNSPNYWRTIDRTMKLIIELRGDVALDEFGWDDLVAITQRWISEEASPNTIKLKLSIIGTIFSIARKRPALTSNIPDLWEFRPTKLPVASRVLDKEEIKEMINYFKAMQLLEFGDMCILALDLGLHVSEVNVMRVDHIEGLDTNSPMVHIQGTKTTARKAKLLMTKRAVEAAKRRIEAVKRGEMFPTYINNKQRVEHTWDRFRTHMGMTEDNCFTFKILRHTCGSTLADTKVDAFKIRDFMRHASIATTERNYIHTAKHRLRDASDSLETHSEL